MTLKTRKTVLIGLSITFVILLMLILCGCEQSKTYTTIIRINPDGISEEWKTCSAVVWNGDGSITFTPLKVAHTLRITGNLTVYETVVIITTKTDTKAEEKK